MTKKSIMVYFIACQDVVTFRHFNWYNALGGRLCVLLSRFLSQIGFHLPFHIFDSVPLKSPMEPTGERLHVL